MSSEPTDQDDRADDELQIKDPDEYNQARRLKTIHQARDDVRKARQDLTKGRAPTAEHRATRQELAQAVATYGHELLPLMDQAGWEHEFENDAYPPIRRFIYAMGSKHVLDVDRELDYTPAAASMQVYGALNEFMAEIGLGADFDDNNSEWEI